MRRAKTIILALLAVVGVLLILSPAGYFRSAAPRFGSEAMGLLKRLELPSFRAADETAGEVVARKVMETVGGRLVEGVIRNGETLDMVLRRAGIGSNLSYAFTTAIRPVFDPRKVRASDEYRLWLDADGDIMKFHYKRSPIEIYEAERAKSGWVAHKVAVPIEKKEETLAGVLEGSLWEAFSRAGANGDLIMSFADLFSWDIDFAHDSQPGDEFRVVYEALYADGKRIGNGRILAASYKDSEHTHTAVYWNSGELAGYFDGGGNSIRKSFLRSPVNFLRISSNFSYARLHPVSHVVKPHLGVDFAAPIGTPVWAVADGTVTRAGFEGGGGNTISIRHAMGYETYYLHLSKFGKNVTTGARVEQGQVIGYVGSTGTSTGPHLDYRVRRNGQWVNPLREKFAPGEPVPPSRLAEYKTWAAEWSKKLEALPTRVQVAGI